MAKLVGESAPDPGDKERFISNDMREQLENMGYDPDAVASSSSVEESASTQSSLENLLSSLSPEARENAESILIDMGEIELKGAEVTLDEQVAELEPVFDKVVDEYAESGVKDLEHMLEEEAHKKTESGNVEMPQDDKGDEVPDPAPSDPPKSPRLQPQRLRDMDGGGVALAPAPATPKTNTSPRRTRPATADKPVDTRTDFDKRLDAAVDKKLNSKHNQAQELKSHIAWQRTLDRSRIGQELQTERDKLDDAKSARWDARLQHNRLTQFMRKAELRGEYERRVSERIDNGEIVGARRQARAYREAKRMAKTQARKERIDARTTANTAVEAARGNIARLKAEKRDLSFIRRKGSRNSYLNARRMVAGGGFSLGEVSPRGMTEEQKKKLENRRKQMLSQKQSTKHIPRGRPSTRQAASSGR